VTILDGRLETSATEGDSQSFHLIWPSVRLQTRTEHKKFFYAEGGEGLAQVAQGGGRCLIPGDIPGQVGRGSEQSDPAEGWARWA